MSDIYAVEITKEASTDLDQIFGWIAQDSPRNASVFLERILNDIFAMKTLPHRYKVRPLGRNSVDIVRSMPTPPFVVWWRRIHGWCRYLRCDMGLAANHASLINTSPAHPSIVCKRLIS